jgi:hypothetical protein
MAMQILQYSFLISSRYENDSKFGRVGYEDEFFRFLQGLVYDVDRRIKRGHQRLALNSMQGNVSFWFAIVQCEFLEVIDHVNCNASSHSFAFRLATSWIWILLSDRPFVYLVLWVYLTLHAWTSYGILSFQTNLSSTCEAAFNSLQSVASSFNNL